jgi:surface antigen/uncharacterized protein YukE
MSQIKADTDALRATIAAMRQGSSAIENALQQAAQAMATLQNSRWSGNHRQQAEEVWTRLQAQFAPTIEALNQIANRTERFTNALEEAGRQFNNGASIPPPGAEAPSKSPQPHTPSPGNPDAGTGGFPPHAPIPPGPTTVPGVLANTAGCTNYVLRRLNLNDMKRWPNALEWNEAATNAGYAVGVKPKSGSVIVFEPGVMGADRQAGHVAYVEDVVQNRDGTFKVTISDANVVYQNGAVVWGTHTPPTRREIVFRQNGDGTLTDSRGNPVNVSFIYGKKV